jgi:lipopolysaccharide assembly outer membrane protein LptD (OstA)
VRKFKYYFFSGLLLLGIGWTGNAGAEIEKKSPQLLLAKANSSKRSSQARSTATSKRTKKASKQGKKSKSQKAQLTANEVRYIDENRQIEAKGQVTVVYRDTVILADYCLLDQGTDTLLAKGKVRLTHDGTTYNAKKLLYYFKSEEGWITPVKAEFSNKDYHEIKEPIKVVADEAFIKGENVLIKRPSVTGCNLAHPHYHFTADRVEYFPDERIVLRHVWYWEGRIRLLYLPVISISLRADEGLDNGFEMPEVGHSDDKGWYLAWGYNYYLNKRNSLRFYLDELTQWGGDGFGVTHTYKPKSTVAFSQDYFYKENSNMGYPKDDYRLKYSYKNTTHPKLGYETTVTAYQKYDALGYSEKENIYYFYLYGKTPWPYLKVFFHDTDSHSAGSGGEITKDTYRQMKLYESWSYNLGKSLALSTTANWSAAGSLSAAELTEQFLYSGTLTKTWTNSNLKLYYNNTRVLSGDYSSSNYLPKLTYTLSKLKLPLLNEIGAVFQYTNLEKVDVDEDDDGDVSINKKTGERWAADITKNNTLWKSKANKLSFNLTSLYMYRYFNIDNETADLTGDLTGFRETVSAKYNFTKHFSVSLGAAYTLRQEEDNKDFLNDDFFDEGDDFAPGGSLTNSWNWSSPKLTASLSGGYSFYTQEPQTLYFTTTWKPGKNNQIYLSTNYDWDDGIGSSYLKLQFNPKENWKLHINLGYNPQTSYWTTKEFQAYITQRLTPNWQLQLNAVYDVFDDDFGLANCALVYNWHCRDVKFYYDYLEKEYWALISFKAFPRAQFKLSSDPDDLYRWYTN